MFSRMKFTRLVPVAVVLAAIAACPNLVMPVSLRHDSASGNFSIGEISFFADSTAASVPLGATNLPARYAKSTIREFQTFFPVAGNDSPRLGDSIPSFVVAVASVARPSLIPGLHRRGNRLEMINYPSRSFRVFTPEEIADNAHLLAGKILLLGDNDDLTDMHATPVTSTMSGVMIHAHSLATIINQQYLDPFSKSQNLALAFGLCFIIVLTSLMLPVTVKGLVMRVMQVLLLYLVVRLGYSLFLDYNLVIDFSYALLMLAFGLFACDIWIGVNTIVCYLIEKVRKLRPAAV